MELRHISDEHQAFVSPTHDSPPSSPTSSSEADDLEDKAPYQTPPLTPDQEDFNPSDTTFRKVLRPTYPLRMGDSGPQPWTAERFKHWIKHKHFVFKPPEDTWRVEPDINLVRRTIKPVLKLLDSSFRSRTCKVTLITTGGFHSVYNIRIKSRRGTKHEFIMRVPIPIYPYYKTESDVATTELVRHFTSIPVPIIYAYDSSANNKLGLEWMLMEKMGGEPLIRRWLDLDNATHMQITQQVANWQNELSRMTDTLIGGLYLRWTTTHLEFFIGRTVESSFYWNRRHTYDVPRGPFRCINEYYEAFLDVLLKEMFDPVYLLLNRGKLAPEQEEALELLKSDKEAILSGLDENERKDARSSGPQLHWDDTSLPAVRALRNAIPTINFPSPDDDPTTLLLHDDISASNLLVDAHGNITALLDWEHNEFKPYIRRSGCGYPTFIDLDEVDESDLDEVKRLSSYDDPEEFWGALGLEQFRIIASHLRPIYRQRLEELQSSLVKLYDEEVTFESQLDKWAMNPNQNERGLMNWLADQLEADDEEND